MLLQEITERLEKWNQGKKEGPLRIELHPTDRCNLSCIFCWKAVSKNRDFPEIPEKRLLKIPREAAQLGVKEWIVSGGGEPLMRMEATLKVLKEIKRYKMWGLLTTNGTLLTEKVAELLVKIGWDQVQLSIDAPGEETNDYLRGRGSFNGVIRAAKALRKAREKKKSNRPFIGFNTILHRLNYKKLDEMIKLAWSSGVELVYFEPIYPGYTSEKLELNRSEERKLKKSIRKALKTARQLKIETNLKTFFETSLTSKADLREKILKEVKNLKKGLLSAPCFRPWYLMGIKASGFAGCCSTFERGEFINNKSLKEVWFGKVFDKLREEMIERKLPPYCSKCSIVVLTENRELRRMLANGSDR